MRIRFIPTLVVVLGTTLPLFSQNLNIPDTNFLNALIEYGVDTNGDGSISQAEAENVKDLDLQMKGISDMTGLEAFINLESLACQMNQFDTLDLSGNMAIKYVNVDLNQLTFLNVSNNMALLSLICSNNRLDTLDVSNNLALETLVMTNNQVTTLDVSDHPVLEHLECSNNQMTILDISNDTSLNLLNCMNNNLSSLDLSTCQSLTYIQLNNMTSLHKVCVWISPFPPAGVTVNSSNSPNITFIDCLPPSVSTPEDTLFNTDTASVVSNEDGFIYLVPEFTTKEIWEIRNSAIDSVATTGDSIVSVSLIGFEKGNYWFYARDAAENISEPDSFTFLGVNLDLEPPNLQAIDTLYQPDSIEVTSSEDGVVYLVPEGTGKELSMIRDSAIDSMAVVRDSAVKISLGGLGNGVYWLYARDTVENISNQHEFTILGVGIIFNTIMDDIRLYPNPVKDILVIETQRFTGTLYQVADVKGRIIENGLISSSPFYLDLSGYPGGIYFLRVKQKNTHKIVKQ